MQSLHLISLLLQYPTRDVQAVADEIGQRLAGDRAIPAAGVEALAASQALPIVVFGHAGNGNLHVNIMYHPDDAAESARGYKTYPPVLGAPRPRAQAYGLAPAFAQPLCPAIVGHVVGPNEAFTAPSSVRPPSCRWHVRVMIKGVS